MPESPHVEMLRLRALHFIGPEVVAWCCACDVPLIERLAAEQREQAPAEVKTALEETVDAAVLEGQELADIGVAAEFLRARLVRPARPAGISMANALRLRCGGDLDARVAADAVVHCLLAIARDQFVEVLGPVDEWSWRGLAPRFSLVHLHPLAERLDAAILGDPDLRALFPKADGPGGAEGTVMRSTGTGGSVQAAVLPMTVLQGAAASLRFSGDVTLERYLSTVEEHVALLRRLARGHEVDVPAIVGLAGPLLDESVLALPWGRLRAARKEESEIRLFGSRSETTAILETDFKLRYEVGSAFDLNRWQRLSRRPVRELERATTLTRLAVLLGAEQPSEVAAAHTWTAVADPLAHGMQFSGPASSGAPRVNHG